MRKDRIDRIIAWLEADLGAHFVMQNWVVPLAFVGKKDLPEDVLIVHEECKTAYCLCGHTNFLRLKDAGMIGAENWQRPEFRQRAQPYLEEIGNIRKASEWLGVGHDEAFNLFFMKKTGGDDDGMRDLFDQLPGDIKARAAIAVMTDLRDTGTANWGRALESVLSPERYAWMKEKSQEFDYTPFPAGIWEGAPA